MNYHGVSFRFLPPSFSLLISLTFFVSPNTASAQITNSCGPGACKGPNLVFNGNFETASPNPNNPIYGFTTEFGTVVCPPANTYDLWGSVTVQNNPTNCYFEWVANDHTLGNGAGNMLVADFPANNPNGTNEYMDIWETGVIVEPGETYCFGAWFMNLNTNPRKSKPKFRYMVNDSLIGISPELSIAGNWEYFAFTYTVPMGDSTLTIALQNGKFGGNGNDLAIDDIEFAKLGAGLSPPTANDDQMIIQSTAVNVPISILNNDYTNNPGESIDTSSLSITVYPQASEGAAYVNQWGEIIFTPAPGFLGTSTFKYQICQSSGCCSEALVTVNIDNILPVEFGDLNVSWMGDRALLNWQTLNEKNNSHFEIQRSVDNHTFETIGYTEGVGTTSQTNAYQYTDLTVQKLQLDRVYYRLKQIDINGTVSLSPTMVLAMELSDVLKMQVYPNPANRQKTIFLDYTNETGEDIYLTVLNVNGKTVHQKTLSGAFAPHAMRLDLSGLSAGMYLVKLASASNHLQASQRLIMTD